MTNYDKFLVEQCKHAWKNSPNQVFSFVKIDQPFSRFSRTSGSLEIGICCCLLTSCLPTICRLMLAVSSTFSICTWRSYFPECFLSVLRMNRIVSTSLFLTLANEVSSGSPSLLHVTLGLGFPCRTGEDSVTSQTVQHGDEMLVVL